MAKNRIFIKGINNKTLELLNEFRCTEKRMRNLSDEYRSDAVQRISAEGESGNESALLNRQALRLLFLSKYSVLKKQLDNIAVELGIEEIYFAYKEIIENGSDLSAFNNAVRSFLEKAECPSKGDREAAFQKLFGEGQKIFDGTERFSSLLKKSCFVHRFSRSEFQGVGGQIEAIGKLSFERIFVDFFLQYLLRNDAYIENADGMVIRNEITKPK